MRKSALAVGLAVLVFGCGGDWFHEQMPEGVELLVDALEVPSWADWGETIKVKNTIYNWGRTGVISPFTVELFLSSDASYDAGTDVVLASRVISSLLGGARDTEETTVTLTKPGPSWNDGQYYIVAYVDRTNMVQEIEGGENDNVRAAGPMMMYTPPAGVDLIMKEVSGPAGAEWGDSIQVSYTVRNRGTVDCTDLFEVSFFLSADLIFDGDPIDPLLGTVGISSLGAQTEVTPPASWVSIPAVSIGDGYYYIIAVANTGASPVAEYGGLLMDNDLASDETIYVANLSDLTVSLIVPGSSTRNWGDAITVDATVTEIRGNPTPAGVAVVVRIWLSANQTVNAADDQLLGALQTTPLAGSESRLVNGTVALTKKAGWTSGGYYVIAQVDPLDAIAEKNEGNNTGWDYLSDIQDPTYDAYEPNNNRTQATNLGTASITTYLYPTIDPANDSDWFQFYIPFSNYYYICFDMDPPAGEDYDVYVYYSTSTIPTYSWNSGGPGVSEAMYNYTGHAMGYWYIVVVSKNAMYSSSIPYSLYVHIW